ncbi:uncharacterized protein LOC123562626 [Mercenaria mercenaria]|uniref:uncharacterized protein LOC123562626 n=1 Tax=Mercenaria mercenaria TaxID=6596 RepID=UPI00234E7CE3|nr:uncharacterized protein LOC123562626 [Mercenaria mercenaria]
MHRLTEQRWACFFWILLSTALVCQIIAFVAPAWLKVFINFDNYYNEKITRTNDTGNATTETSINITTSVPIRMSTLAPKRIPVNQDYALWYMTQCHIDTWACETLTYYHIEFMDESYDKANFKEPHHWFLDRTNLFLNGVELRFNYSVLSENQAEYTFGLLACGVAWWLVYRHRKRLGKKNLDKVKNTRLAVAAVTSFFSGLFVLIPVGRFGNMGDKLRSLAKDYPDRISVHKPIGLGFGAAGGTFAMMVGLIIALRIVLRGYCPDCVDLPPQDEIAMRETGNQIDNPDKRHSQNNM